MIVYPLNPPQEFCAMAVTVRTVNTAGNTHAPWTGVEQVQEWNGGRWEMEISFPPCSPKVGEPIVAFLDSLRGRFGTFRYGPPRKMFPSGAARNNAGNPTVSGGAQSGLTLGLATAGLGNVKNYLRAGDFLELPYSNSWGLYRVTRDVDLIADRATLNIWPRLRGVPNHADPITVINPRGMFRLATDDPRHEVDESGIYRIDVVPIREAFGQ